MTAPANNSETTARDGVVSLDGLQALIDILRADGHTVLGPTRQGQAVVYDEVETVGDLPSGWTDTQGPGTYRLERREDDALFGYVAGVQSWKRFLFPPERTLFRATRDGNGFTVDAPQNDAPKYAFLGVRACELAAIAIQDRIFVEGDFRDPDYARRRENALLIAVNCGQAGATCFCVSMDTGPGAESGFDLAITELFEGGHRFLLEAGSEAGTTLLERLPVQAATDADRAEATTIVERTARSMGRHMETDGLKELLQANLEHHRWDDVADRCLACGNCTFACPTCFCSSVEEATDVSGDTAERTSQWASCFSLDFSYVHGGGPVRSETRSRYRQWMTHKLAGWIDQFDTSGCVGCGRCITWCPVGIDITEEAAAIRGARGE